MAMCNQDEDRVNLAPLGERGVFPTHYKYKELVSQRRARNCGICGTKKPA